MGRLDVVVRGGPETAAAASAATAAFAAAVLTRSGTPPTSYGGVSPALHALDLVAGLGLTAGGLAAFGDRLTRRAGLVALAAGALWFAPDWEGWDSGPALVRSLGSAAAPFFVVAILWLVLAAPRQPPLRRGVRAPVAATALLALLVALERSLVRDPLLDLYCWRNCVDNVFLVHAHPGLADGVEGVWLAASVAIGLAVVAVAAWRLRTAGGAGRLGLAPLLLPGGLLGAAEAAYAARLLDSRFEDPSASDLASLFAARSLAAALLAVGLVWLVVRGRRRRARVAHLAAELGDAPPPGQLRARLAAAVGDPTLEVAHWLPSRNGYVDADGRAVALPSPSDGRAMTSVVRDARPVALIVHDPGSIDHGLLDRELGPAVRLAIENERLRAEVRAQLHDLRESRARIVESGDAERRRLERNLHDGAQQSLVALSYDLRLAGAAARSSGNTKLRTLLSECEAESQLALDDLRELAEGIYPAILTEGGLASALPTLAEKAPLAVELGDISSERYDASVEAAVYVAVLAAIEAAGRSAATFVEIAVVRAPDAVVVTARDDGDGSREPLVHVADRVGALGGTLEVTTNGIRVEVPCA